MNKKQFIIDDIIKNELETFLNTNFIETNSKSLEILNWYKTKLKKQYDEISKLNQYKTREMDAFVIGDAVSDGICVVDSTGNITAVNKNYTDITGNTKEMVLGKNLNTLIKNGVLEKSVSLMCIEQKKKLTLLLTSENNKKLLVTSTPFFEKNKITKVITVMRDMTKLIKLKEDLEEVEKKNKKYLQELNYYKNKQIDKSNFVGQSPEIRKIKDFVKYISNTDVTILITGETGCGKEVISNEIYHNSTRKEKPYIKVNCAAIPETLIESELFGYVEGAFTGAQTKGKVGMFESANKGTILLDEISEMPLSLQPKLLRVLQEKEITRVGGNKNIPLDVRIITATNQNLLKLVEEGKFRKDLFYRLNVIPIVIPPLRDRKDDIFHLAHRFLIKFNLKYSKEKSFNSNAILALESYNWPGNVRELENICERLIVTDDDNLITYEKVANTLEKNNNSKPLFLSGSLKEAINALEKKLIKEALEKHGSTYKASKILGISQPTVFRKAKSLGIKLTEK
ncbi:MAG: sigma 54-interacting transcriptional regulator [Clostridiales bacterium]